MFHKNKRYFWNAKTIYTNYNHMRKYLFTAAAALMAMVAVPAQAQNSRIVEEGGSGPYKAIMMEEATLTTHTIFRPQDLSKFGKKNLLPVLVWGNGGCANSPSGHINFLNEVASQGFLIVAIGPSNYQQQEAPRPGPGDLPYRRTLWSAAAESRTGGRRYPDPRPLWNRKQCDRYAGFLTGSKTGL